MMYRVIWEIDIDADDPREAAEIALEIQRDPNSTATVFTCHDGFGNETCLDLTDYSAGRNQEISFPSRSQ